MSYRLHFTTPPAPLLRRDVARLIDDLLPAASAFRAPAVPAVTRREHDDRTELSLDLPGVAPESLDLTVEDGTLRISGSRGDQRFVRSVTLADGTDPTQVTATAVHGVLTVSIAKPTRPAPHRVAVQVGQPVTPTA
jgi:HSP20 family protein